MSSEIDLIALAQKINEFHHAAESAFSSALNHAKAAGMFLQEAKNRLPHGQWLRWLKTNCPEIKERTATNYMRIAKDWGSLPPEVGTIQGALKYLTPPKSADHADLVSALDNKHFWERYWDSLKGHPLSGGLWFMRLEAAHLAIGSRQTSLVEELGAVNFLQLFDQVAENLFNGLPLESGITNPAWVNLLKDSKP
jgi:hypothetical protein